MIVIRIIKIERVDIWISYWGLLDKIFLLFVLFNGRGIKSIDKIGLVGWFELVVFNFN